MNLHDFHYELPADYIARYPLAKRSQSRLLCLSGNSQAMHHRLFTDLTDLVQPNDLLIFNDSRVIPARLFGSKETGGLVEVLVERVLNAHSALAMIRASKPPKPGSFIQFTPEVRAQVIHRQHELYELQFLGEKSVFAILDAIGQIPLPPYLGRLPEEADKERYQTIFAKQQGSIAAPTAGLHFDHELLDKLKNKNVELAYLTLHIGLGTFAPVRVTNIQEHRMHSEYIEVNPALIQQIQQCKARQGRVIAVGTTTARALETASLSGELRPFSGETDIFIYPGFQFRCIDALITNLHLPSSTLLMLVCALGGYQRVMQAYQTAVKEKYRFFSYGDAMWVESSELSTDPTR